MQDVQHAARVRPTTDLELPTCDKCGEEIYDRLTDVLRKLAKKNEDSNDGFDHSRLCGKYSLQIKNL